LGATRVRGHRAALAAGPVYRLVVFANQGIIARMRPFVLTDNFQDCVTFYADDSSQGKRAV
jgi:hypothetical protein